MLCTRPFLGDFTVDRLILQSKMAMRGSIDDPYLIEKYPKRSRRYFSLVSAGIETIAEK